MVFSFKESLKRSVYRFQVVYGEKLKNSGTGYKDHVAQMASVVSRLSELESKAQTMFLKRFL